MSIARTPSRPSSWMTIPAPSVNVRVMIRPNRISPITEPGSRCRAAKILMRSQAGISATPAFALASAPNTAFASRNSSKPNAPHSRPLPDCL